MASRLAKLLTQAQCNPIRFRVFRDPEPNWSWLQDRTQNGKWVLYRDQKIQHVDLHDIHWTSAMHTTKSTT